MVPRENVEIVLSIYEALICGLEDPWRANSHRAVCRGAFSNCAVSQRPLFEPILCVDRGRRGSEGATTCLRALGAHLRVGSVI
jgi:hypothetical protein